MTNETIVTFEDATDTRLGRYNFSYETHIMDFDGYIIASPRESRAIDTIEWGINVPIHWEEAESILLNKFYEWKNE